MVTRSSHIGGTVCSTWTYSKGSTRGSITDPLATATRLKHCVQHLHPAAATAPPGVLSWPPVCHELTSCQLSRHQLPPVDLWRTPTYAFKPCEALLGLHLQWALLAHLLAAWPELTAGRQQGCHSLGRSTCIQVQGRHGYIPHHILSAQTAPGPSSPMASQAADVQRVLLHSSEL